MSVNHPYEMAIGYGPGVVTLTSNVVQCKSGLADEDKLGTIQAIYLKTFRRAVNNSLK